MKNNATEYLQVWRRRAMGALGALMIAASALAVTASAASAETRCRYSGPSYLGDACLTIIGEGEPGMKLVRVSINVSMSLQDAEAILAENYQPFWVVAYGEDGLSGDDYLFPIPIKEGWPIAWNGGLKAEFERRVPQTSLDENDGQDEVYARILLFGPGTNQRRTYTTPTLRNWY